MWRSLAATATLTVALTIPRFCNVAQETPASQKSLAEQLVDAFNGVFGVHPGMRANHPKGVVLEGTFTPDASAASVSKAAHLQKKKAPVPVTVRFSAGSGQPTVPDTRRDAAWHGSKVSLPDGSNTDLVVLSFNGFPVATAEEFRDFLLAIAASGPDAPKPTAFEAFLGAHPAAKNFVEAPKPQPVSYATLPYFGINSFKFTNAKGAATLVATSSGPVAGEHFLTQEQLVNDGVRLSELLRFANGCAVVPPSSNCSCRWLRKMTRSTIPRSRGRTVASRSNWVRSSITKAVADSQTAEKKLLFMPGALVPGIEAADPMIAARSASYIVSLSRRAQTQ